MKYLFIGGPADGKVYEAKDNMHRIRVPVLSHKATMHTGEFPVTPSFSVAEYRRTLFKWSIGFTYFTSWVYTFGDVSAAYMLHNDWTMEQIEVLLSTQKEDEPKGLSNTSVDEL